MDTSTSSKSTIEKFVFVVGIIASIITIVLTFWNTHTKNLIDQKQVQLGSLKLKLQERTTGLEESKERVERYKWVFSLFPDIDNKDPRKKSFTASLIRLALTDKEAQQLFASLQTSSDTTLQTIGQNGLTAIQSEPIQQLIQQMNDNTATIRKNAVAELERNYFSSSQAINLTLDLYTPDNLTIYHQVELLMDYIF